jgi:hypothetical protein
MKALVHLAWGDKKVPDCTRCEGDPRVRAAFGCDGPARDNVTGTPLVVFRVSCSACGGDGECDQCDRNRMTPLFRCPKKLLAEAGPLGEKLGRVFHTWSHYRQHGVLPYAGGLAQQALTCMTAFDVMAGELAMLEKERRESDERDQVRRELMAKKPPTAKPAKKRGGRGGT